MDRFEIDETDINVMKNIMFATYSSKYSLHKVTKIPYATLLRRMDRLSSKEYEMIARSPEHAIRKNGKPDKRQPETWDLTFKGLTYLIVNDYLSDRELDDALKRLMDSSKYLKSLRSIMRFMTVPKYRSIVGPSLKEAVYELRSKINFQHFDKEYAAILFFRVIEHAFLERTEEIPKKTPEELKRLVKETGIKTKLLKSYKVKLELAQSAKKEAEQRIGDYRTILKFVRNIR